MQKITPFLWFDSQAEEAVNFYLSMFKNSKITKVARYPEGSPGPAGKVMTVEFELDGQQFIALNGGPIFRFTEAVSFVINCKSQAEVDHYYDGLRAGGSEQQCGWVKDKYGLSWQIVPDVMGKLFSGGDAARSKRVMQAMLQMKKLDIAKLQAAYDGK
jgi:predicted 3-demethylubiquinone-9 3-methyltransferase (glyoxalase superfamily)